MAIIPKNEKGVALILTITLIGLIVILTLQFSKSILAGLYETANFDDGIKLGVIAKSGFNCALAVLYEDGTDVDSLHDDWASMNQYASYSAELFDNDGMFQTEVTDLTGKIQINKLINKNSEGKEEFNSDQKGILERLLSEPPFDLKSEEIEDILNAVKDWIDEDGETEGLDGAEDSYYQSLENPYSCRNAPFKSVDELLLVKGITTELFYGTTEKPGISAYLTTVSGDGKININTADPIVLKALSSEELDDSMIEEMVEYRNNEDDLSRPDWYKTALGTSEEYFAQKLITTKSSYFEITSRGIKDSRNKGMTAIVKRNGKSLTVRSWKML